MRAIEALWVIVTIVGVVFACMIFYLVTVSPQDASVAGWWRRMLYVARENWRTLRSKGRQE